MRSAGVGPPEPVTRLPAQTWHDGLVAGPPWARRLRHVTASPLRLRQPRAGLTDGVVLLRPWDTDDVPALVSAIDGDAEISRWLELIPQPYREQEAREWVETATRGWREGSLGAFAVCGAQARGVLGGVGLSVRAPDDRVAEIGYWTAAGARGRGVTTRAVALLSRWALDEAGAERVQLRAELENVASQRVADKAGFVREGVLRSYRFNPRLGRRMDFVMYSLLPADSPPVGDAESR